MLGALGGPGSGPAARVFQPWSSGPRCPCGPEQIACLPYPFPPAPRAEETILDPFVSWVETIACLTWECASAASPPPRRSDRISVNLRSAATAPPPSALLPPQLPLWQQRQHALTIVSSSSRPHTIVLTPESSAPPRLWSHSAPVPMPFDCLPQVSAYVTLQYEQFDRGDGAQVDSGPSWPRQKRKASRISSETPSTSQVIYMCTLMDVAKMRPHLAKKRPHLVKKKPVLLVLSLLGKLLSQEGEYAGGAGPLHLARRARREPGGGWDGRV